MRESSVTRSPRRDSLLTDIRSIPCLSMLPDEQLSIAIRGSEVKQFGKGEQIFIESEPVRHFFLVKEGLVKLFKTSEGGKELVLNFLKAGDHFCLIMPEVSKKHMVSAMAMEDSVLVLIDAQNFAHFLNSVVGDAGMKIISGLCCRIKKLSSIIDDLAFKDVDQRVAINLLRLATEIQDAEKQDAQKQDETKLSQGKRDNEQAFDSDTVTLTITHQEIASMVGTVREVVSRSISRLKKINVIVSSSSKGFKLDRRRLEEYIRSAHPEIN